MEPPPERPSSSDVQLVCAALRASVPADTELLVTYHSDSGPLKGASVALALAAYEQLFDELAPNYDLRPYRTPPRALRWLQSYVGKAVGARAEQREGIIELVDYATSNPDRFVATATEVLRYVEYWSPYVTTLDAAGRLSRIQYDACGFKVRPIHKQCTRTQYLRRQLSLGRNLLSTEQTELANVLAESWGGTLGDLRSTARVLTSVDRP